MLNKTKLAELLKDTELDFIDVEYVEAADTGELIEYIQGRIYEQEIIYYHKAMDYLMEHDASLCESMGLAHEYGYTADNINSELLATLLYQSKLMTLSHEIDFEECFES